MLSSSSLTSRTYLVLNGRIGSTKMRTSARTSAHRLLLPTKSTYGSCSRGSIAGHRSLWSSSSSSSSLQSIGCRRAGMERVRTTTRPPTTTTVMPDVFLRTFLDVKSAADKSSTAGNRGKGGKGGGGGRSEADLLVEELQELYEAAKDEFEIATDSTESATIYAASDREAARDALDQFLGVYHLYTTAPETTTSTTQPHSRTPGSAGSVSTSQQEQENQIEDLEEAAPAPADNDGSNLITTNYDPTTIPAEVRDEVKRRIGQRVRELKRAVEDLEERAHAE